MSLLWVATKARNGEKIDELPDLQVDGIKSVIGRYDTATAGLPIPTAPEGWERICMQGATNLHLLSTSESNPRGVPIWGAEITAVKKTQGDTVELSLATIENYFRRRFIGDRTFTQVGQNVILATLINDFVAVGPNGGIPIRVQYTGPGKLRDQTYKDREDKSVYSAMQDWSGIIGGPEWTVGWEWQSNPERITPVIYIGDRIGSPVTPGLGANATFNLPGDIKTFEHDADYSDGNGATSVMAVSSGQGDDRPQSAVQTIADPDRPTREFRYTPSTSIKLQTTLDDYALKAAQSMKNGNISIALSSNLESGPPLGVDWVIGDDVGFDIRTSAFPAGLRGTARTLGYSIDLKEPQTITPILAGGSI